MKRSTKVVIGVGVVAAVATSIAVLAYSRPASAKPAPSLPKPGNDLAKEAAACKAALAEMPLEDPGYGVKPQTMTALDWLTRVALHKAYPGSNWPVTGSPGPEFPAENATYLRVQSCTQAGLNALPQPAPPIGVVERPGYTITPSCGGVSVWNTEQAMAYARQISQITSSQFGLVDASLAAAEAVLYGGCSWQTIRDVAPLFWYRMRIGFFRGAVDAGLLNEQQAQTQVNNMRAFPPFGLDPSMMTPYGIWGDDGQG